MAWSHGTRYRLSDTQKWQSDHLRAYRMRARGATYATIGRAFGYSHGWARTLVLQCDYWLGVELHNQGYGLAGFRYHPV